MASLALQLQMRTQSCHDEIGRIGAELQAIVPRCAADVGRLQVGLEGMELDVRGLLDGMEGSSSGNGELIKRQSSKVEKSGANNGVTGADVSAGVGVHHKSSESGNNPLATLQSLLNLRTHLTATRTILSAASSWDETINSIPMLLSTSPPNLVEATAAVSQLERGARALRGMPEGREERDAALARLRTQLEVLLKPQLRHALRKMDTRLGPLQQCVQMYDSLGKMSVMREEYVRMRPGEIHGLWFSFGGIDCGTGKAESKEKDTEGTDSKRDSEEEEEVGDFDFDDEESLSPSANEQPQQHQQTSFMDFLPTFYEAVLELLSKERTQSRLVFGPEMAPFIVTQILQECFSSIVDSFQKRLATLCSLNGKGHSNSSADMGGTEAIAAAYEATVQFLSLAYDQIEAWNIDSTANDSTGDEDESLLELIRSTLLLVASPFLPYQRNLAETERHPMGEAASIVARDVRGVVNLEDAAERLGDLAPFMFPLVEASMKRFELLNSGYNATATLSSVDSIISNHASELAISIGTKSSNSGGADSEFDEQHVNCALEILRIAGQFKRQLLSFECSVKDQLVALSNEIQLADTLFEQDSSGIAFVPEELSPIQIRALLAKAACDVTDSTQYVDDGTGVKCPTTVVQLQRLAGGREISTNKEKNSGRTSPPLFPKALDAMSQLSSSALRCVFEVCSAVPERELNGISALPVWKQDSRGSSVDDETSYGTLPQQFITHVGEHMLALVQALEPFASDPEALELASEVMANVLDVAIQPWKEFVTASGYSFETITKSAGTEGKSEKRQLETLIRGKDLEKYLFNENSDGYDSSHDEDIGHEEEGEEEEEEDSKASAKFCNQWLDVVSLAVTGRLLERAMRIPRLGRNGAEHLSTDLNYISNVFTALGLRWHPHPLLGYVAQLATLEDGILRERIQRRQQQDIEGDSTKDEVLSEMLIEVIRRTELRIAHVRSIFI